MSEFNMIFRWPKNDHFSLQKRSILIVFLSKSGNPRFGNKNVRIPYDFQVAKNRAFLITKTIDFGRFLVEIRTSQIWIRKCTISIGKTTISQHGNEFSFDSSTFLQHWCPENKAKQRFHDQHVRQFYVFATLMSRKHGKTTISQPKCATVQRFCNTDVRKTQFFNDFTALMCDSSTFVQH